MNIDKQLTDTSIRISYYDNFRVLAGINGNCQWEVMFNGASCPSGAITMDLFEGGGNYHSHSTVSATCTLATAGPVAITVDVGPVPGQIAGDCMTGWNSGYWHMDAEEVR